MSSFSIYLASGLFFILDPLLLVVEGSVSEPGVELGEEKAEVYCPGSYRLMLSPCSFPHIPGF